ncbi:MAG: hypothetical protein R3300_20300 [Candidatus Promineifilaceae bacterium]|nr:hypothetical protein [Candidatus Promineifilaceae bacterium]
MVHALQEGWRVLAPAGQLIDMRPQSARPTVEVVDERAVVVAGQVDESAGASDYEAADRAMAAMVAQGRFAKQREKRFPFSYYWPTVEQMQAYIEEAWSDFAVLPEQVVQRARELTPGGATVRYRVRETILIADYRKQR